MSVYNPETKVWRGPLVPWPVPWDKYISELVIEGLSKNPKRVVQISYDDNIEMTCEELRSKIIRVALNLQKLGIRDGDVVAVICANSLDLMAYVNGIIQLGAIVNPMCLDHSIEDLINMFKKTKPKLVICDADFYDTLTAALNVLENDCPIYTTLQRIEGVNYAEELFNETGDEDDYQPIKFENPNHRTMAILASSGSSGPLKGVCVSQTFFLKVFTGVFRLTEEARSLSFSPIFWGSAFGSLLLAGMSGETRIVTKKPFSAKLFIDIAKKYNVNYYLMNPSSMTLLLQSPLIDTIDKADIKIVLALGGIVTDELRKRFKEVFPKTYLMIFYGLTECSCTVTFPGQPIDGFTVGYVLPNHELKIVDDDGNALGTGEIGEIYIRFTLVPFLGYYDNPEGTKDALDEDGFIKTGDIGYVDEKGFVFVTDRKKDIFKWMAHSVNPSEIESVIQELEAVELVSVVGIPNDATFGLGAAIIQKKEGYDSLSEQDVVDYVAQKLPRYKHLHGGAYFIEKIPTTATQKILKRETLEIAIKLFKERQNTSSS